MSCKPNPLPLRDVLLSKIRVVRGCWEWTGAMSSGYGQLTYQQKHMLAHRAAAEILGGMCTKNKMVCHHCDNRACINPDHLYVGDAKDNRRDALERDRWRHPWGKREACTAGHKYGPNSYRIAKDGSRVCRICMRDHTRNWRSKQ